MLVVVAILFLVLLGLCKRGSRKALFVLQAVPVWLGQSCNIGPIFRVLLPIFCPCGFWLRWPFPRAGGARNCNGHTTFPRRRPPGGEAGRFGIPFSRRAEWVDTALDF